MARTDLTARYIELVEELGAKLDHKYGWQRLVAEQLGIDQPTLTKILRGDRTVGWELAQRAVERLKLDPRYFSGSRSRRVSSAARDEPARSQVNELAAKVRANIATTNDVYALARSLIDDPVVKQARAILKMKRPRNDQQIGALYVAASRLVDLLDETDRHRKKSD